MQNDESPVAVNFLTINIEQECITRVYQGTLLYTGSKKLSLWRFCAGYIRSCKRFPIMAMCFGLFKESLAINIEQECIKTVYQATLMYAGYFRSRERFSTNPCGEMASQSAVGAEKHSGVISYFLSNLEWSDKKNMYDLSYFLNAVATSIKERTLFHYFT